MFIEEPGDESTEFPTEEEPMSTEDLSDFKDVTIESGEYTTYMFQYENEQYMGLDNPKEKCFDDYTKCVTSIAYVILSVSRVQPDLPALAGTSSWDIDAEVMCETYWVRRKG